MLYLMIIWFILLIIFCVIGTAARNLLQASEFVRWSDRWIVSIWLGIIVSGTVLLLISLWLPLATQTGIGIAVLLGGLALLQRPVRADLQIFLQQLSPFWLSFGVAAVPIAAIMVQPVTWVDTGLYQYSLVQWLHQIGTVPGIALLFANFGFNSIWFALAAPLNPGLLATRGSVVLNGLVLLVALLQSLVVWQQIWNGQGRLSDWFLALALPLLLLCSLLHSNLNEIAVSPSPDLPIAFLIAIVSWTVLILSEARPQTAIPGSNGTGVPLILAVGAIAIKLTALPLGLVIGLFYGFYNRRSIRKLGFGLLLVVLLLLPFGIAQVLTSGCPLFPSNLWCVDAPFALSRETSQVVAQLTHSWATWYGASFDYPASLLTGFLDWLNDNFTNQLILILGIIAGLIGLWVVQWSRKQAFPGVVWVLLIQITSLLFHTATTLFFRFMFPSLVLVPALLAAMYGFKAINPKIPQIRQLIQQSRFRFNRRWIPIALFLITVSFVIVVTANSASLFLPPPLRTPVVILKRVNDFFYFAPQQFEDLCWATQIPCAFEITPDVHLRDPDQGVRAGFVRR